MKKSEMETLKRMVEGYKITLTTEYFIKDDGKNNFPKKGYKDESKTIDAETYVNIFGATDFFKSIGGYERITKTYTIAGYIPTKLTSISPDKKRKTVRIFEIKR